MYQMVPMWCTNVIIYQINKTPNINLSWLIDHQLTGKQKTKLWTTTLILFVLHALRCIHYLKSLMHVIKWIICDTVYSILIKYSLNQKDFVVSFMYWQKPLHPFTTKVINHAQTANNNCKTQGSINKYTLIIF